MEDKMILRKDWFVVTNGQKIEEYYNLKAGVTFGSGAFGRVVMAKKKNTELFRAKK